MLTPLDVAISLKNVETVCKIINKIPKVIIISKLGCCFFAEITALQERYVERLGLFKFQKS